MKVTAFNHDSSEAGQFTYREAMKFIRKAESIVDRLDTSDLSKLRERAAYV